MLQDLSLPSVQNRILDLAQQLPQYFLNLLPVFKNLAIDLNNIQTLHGDSLWNKIIQQAEDRKANFQSVYEQQQLQGQTPLVENNHLRKLRL